MEDRNKNIDKLIKQNLKIEEPSLDFSSDVMDQVFASDLKKEKALSFLLQKHILEEPSIDFTTSVFSKIEQDSKAIIYQPVLGKKAWFLLSSLVVFIVVYVLMNMENSSGKYVVIGDVYSKMLAYISIDLPTLSISPLYAFSIFVLSSLLFLDYFLRNRSLS